MALDEWAPPLPVLRPSTTTATTPFHCLPTPFHSQPGAWKPRNLFGSDVQIAQVPTYWYKSGGEREDWRAGQDARTELRTERMTVCVRVEMCMQVGAWAKRGHGMENVFHSAIISYLVSYHAIHYYLLHAYLLTNSYRTGRYRGGRSL
ncbi:hypothetical protein BU24DRAFT_246520 [Aaosphaeria arxii CBS 175.79]|uniref:Uncharacterized protein n=1 Tax=Aaosphaeria arxii CBS 175.79 TaxID=1450172 RepID=A0A6A5XLS7_9PLEO|nr:uncharacterized protein BU24DRAFT_246520 [Aaosphaeria arxii CBS 175.79]KAF2013771.1 hypothetical protein BU24DRAFT_246520 [Aaosphaeria arxii CBS 175.79]